MITAIPVGIIGFIAALLAYHDDYEDGLIGRSAFSVMVLIGTIVVIGAFIGRTYHVPLEIDVLLYSIAAFMIRHAYRFLKYHRTGKYAWNREKA